MHSVSQDCVSVKWLLETMEALLLTKGSDEFYRSSRVDAKVYIT